LSTTADDLVAAGRVDEKGQSCKEITLGGPSSGQETTRSFTMSNATLTRFRDEAGTTTAEYTVVTGAACGFGALLYKLLTSEWGQRLIETAFKAVLRLIGF